MMKSVLIADDHEFGGLIVAGAAREAVEMAEVFHPDLVLLDLSMPVMNGIEAACEVKRLMPMVPIIVFSEYGDVFSEPEARRTGISAVVSKDANLSVLLDRARSVFYPMAA